ncbi:MAG: hypothetical protein WCE68_10350 [Anaerolineales bacterium]
MIRKLSFFFTFLGAALITLAYMMARLFWPAGVFSLLIVLWMIVFFRGGQWIHTPGLFLAFCFTAAGLYLHLNAGLIFSAAFLALAGWDLAAFTGRLELVGTETDATYLQKRHLLYLGVVLAIGIGLVLLALNLHLFLPFGWITVLVLLLAGGLGLLIDRLLRGS